MRALQLNPFVKCRGFELFAVLEQAEGRVAIEPVNRRFRQHAIDIIHRFLSAPVREH